MKILATSTWLAAALATGAAAQDVVGNSASDGRQLFETYCATCHGLDAMGKGPMAPVLLVQPKNLTALAAENGGVFPTFRVIRRIDGRDPLVSHGSPMPVFGSFFEGKGETIQAENGQMVMTSAPVIALVEYLKSLQVQ